MLEIIALYFLTAHNGKIAERKGLKPMTWKINTVIAWFIGEIIGIIVAINLFHIHQAEKLSNAELIKMSLVALPFGFAGFHFIKYTLEKKPDNTPPHFE